MMKLQKVKVQYEKEIKDYLYDHLLEDDDELVQIVRILSNKNKLDGSIFHKIKSLKSPSVGKIKKLLRPLIDKK